jgi:hypothetical protein
MLLFIPSTSSHSSLMAQLSFGKPPRAKNTFFINYSNMLQAVKFSMEGSRIQAGLLFFRMPPVDKPVQIILFLPDGVDAYNCPPGPPAEHRHFTGFEQRIEDPGLNKVVFKIMVNDSYQHDDPFSCRENYFLVAILSAIRFADQLPERELEVNVPVILFFSTCPMNRAPAATGPHS